MLLVVDADTASAFVNYFESYHHYNSEKRFCAVYVAANGHTALESFAPNKAISVVVLDAQLPDMTRKEFLAELSSTSSQYLDPVLVNLLSFVFLDDGQMLVDEVVPAVVRHIWHVVKPIDFDEIEKILPRLAHTTTRSELRQLTTRLPCGKLIEERLRALLKEKEWVLLYIGIDGYELYEARYGWKSSEQVQRFLADLIEEVVDEYSASADFIGHIGGEDFVVIISWPEKAEIIAQQLHVRFTSRVEHCYPTESKIPPLQIAIGIVYASDGPFTTINEIEAKASASREGHRSSE
jgi:GGDEF domain-containing protein